MSATVDDVLSLLDEMNEQGRIEYADYSQLHDAIAATLGGGNLTAEQVRGAIKQHSFGIQPELGYGEFGRCFHDKSWQAIADELNRIRKGSGTCELRDATWDDDYCTWGVICSACGARHEHTYGYGWNFAPCCGKRIRKAVKR